MMFRVMLTVSTSATNIGDCPSALQAYGAVYCATYPHEYRIFAYEAEGLMRERARDLPGVMRMEDAEASFGLARNFYIDEIQLYVQASHGSLIVFLGPPGSASFFRD